MASDILALDIIHMYTQKEYSYCIDIYLMQQHPVTHGNSNMTLLILTPISNISSFTKDIYKTAQF